MHNGLGVQHYIQAIDRCKQSCLLPVYLDLFKSVVSNSQPLVDGPPVPMLAFGSSVKEWKERESGKDEFTTTTVDGELVKARNSTW